MAAKRKRSAYRAETYVDGNTVRKINKAPLEKPEHRKENEHKERKHHKTRKEHISGSILRRNQQKALHMDGPYVFSLTIAVVVTLGICLNYLHMQSTITTRIHNIEELELQLETLKSGNDALQTRLDTYVDLDHIFKVATEELGMVYANKDQILLYNRSESEYVRQYEDIPKHE